MSHDLLAGVIRPGRTSAALTVLFGLGLAAVGALGLAGPAWPLGVLAALIGLAMAAFMAPSLTGAHAVAWDETGLEGPSRTLGLTLGLAKDRILWADLAAAGKTASGYWYVEAGDGRRVHWSWLYPGHDALTEALARHRPDLRLPADMARA